MGPRTAPVERCVRCVMDTTDPDIEFDADGVCSHCRSYDANFRDTVEAATAGRRLPELHALVEQIKADGAKSEYDCVVGVSGGVDSSYVLLKAKELGLRPLAVHFDSGWNSELAVNNIENITTTLDVDLKTEVVNWQEMRDLQLAFFEAGVANCDIPTDHAFPAVALREAAAHGAKYILSGSNLATESVLPTAWGHNAADVRYLKAIHREHGSVKLKTYPTLGLAKQAIWYPYVRGVKTVQGPQLPPLRQARRQARDQRQPRLARLRRQALRVGLHALLPGLLPPGALRLRQAPGPPLLAHPLGPDDPRGGPRATSSNPPTTPIYRPRT